LDGTPVSDGRRLYVAMRHSDVTPHAYVACFDAATGARRWRTSIGAADTPAGGLGDEITHNLLTLVENRVYFNTNLGLVAALDAENGDIRWISRYDRFTEKTFMQGVAGPPHFDRDPAPCLYHDGLVIVAPSDSPAIFALDADTGKTVWQQNQLPNALHLLGVVGTRLIVSGERVASLDIASGNLNWTWPESAHAGIRGMGRGVVAGNEIFWPTRNQILVLDVKKGGQTRSPIELAPLAGGANLAVAHGRLIAAGYDKLTIFGPAATAAPKPAEATSADAAARTGRLSDQSEIK
jgi:outer membrane protein assembly factor BamB